MSAEFVDKLPPAGDRSARRNALREFASELLDNPGRWAKYPTKLSPSGLAARASEINRGHMSSFEGGKFEAAVRAGVLYVRAVKDA